MAEASISAFDLDEFSCAICLDLLKDPVTTNCGHSFCMGCITGCWDQDDPKGVYSCPQCRETFTPRPVLRRNTILAGVVEKLKKMRLQVASPAQSYAGPGDVECDVCTERKHKAVKSCLVCLASYCETHFKLHNDLNPGNKHNVIDATSKLQERICSHHDKLLEIFCRTDQQCICYLCTMNQHKGHDTVSAAAERNQKLRQLGATLTKTGQRIQEREKKLQELRQAVKSFTSSAQAAVEDSERIFTELIRSIERKRSEVKKLIRAQEKAELSQTEGLLEQLEQEVAELRRRDAELEQLSHTEDHIHFLQSFQSLSAPPGSDDLPSITVNPHLSFGDLKKSLSELKERIEVFCKEKLDKICGKVTKVRMVLPSEPKTRQDFLQYSCQLTLDPNTAFRNLCLSGGNRSATWSDQAQSYPDHPNRFTWYYQVLCRESVSGRCYWEAEWSGQVVSIAVSYIGISRKEWHSETEFGWNDQSWSLFCSPTQCYFIHNNDYVTNIPVPTSSRVGVYLDHRAGTLSFYSVSDTMTLLHRVQTTFSQPLYPGFYVGKVSNVKICQVIK